MSTNIFDNSPTYQQRFDINGATSIPENSYFRINCVDRADQTHVCVQNNQLSWNCMEVLKFLKRILVMDVSGDFHPAMLEKCHLVIPSLPLKFRP